MKNLKLLVFVIMCWAATAVAQNVENQWDNPIAVPGLEPAKRVVEQQQKAKYESLEDVPDIDYIRDDIPEAEVPEIKGKRHDALVPDTCDLAERARLVVNHMTSIACEEADGEIYYIPQINTIPPRFSLQPGSGQLWPKYMEALPLMRLMSGSRQDTKVDWQWAEVILKSIGEDGLYYLPLAGRPWDPPGAFGSPDRGPYRGAIHVHGGRMLGVLALYYRITGDEVWLETGKQMVDGLADLVTVVDGKGMIHGVYYFPGDQPPANAEEIAREQLKKSKLFSWDGSLYTTWMITGLSQFYQASRYKPAKELAECLARALKAQYPEDGQWFGHHHCGTLAVHAFAELAVATGDKEWKEMARKTYEWAKNKEEMGAIPSIGYFPVMQAKTRTSREPMEPCSVGDMTAIAAKLTQLGFDQYYDDIEQYVRNGLIECQFSQDHHTTDYIHRMEIGEATGYGYWNPGLVKKPLEYNDTSEDFARKMIGFFSSTTFPNDLNTLAGYDLCCAGNCSRALYYAWESILDYSGGELKVNLLLNRASKWADVDSYLPYEGRVEIHVKRPVRLKVRMNDWINMESVSCSIDGKDKKISSEGRYVNVGRVRPGKKVTLEFPITERTEEVTSFDLHYTVTYRGADVVDIVPRGINTPQFTREKYRTSQPRFVESERFVCEKEIRW